MNDLFKGMLLLLSIKPDVQMHAEHDQIFLGPGLIAVSEEEKQILDKLGWFIDDEADPVWSHFT